MTAVRQAGERRRRRLDARADDGLTLVEVLVSLGILAGISLAAVSGLLLSTKVSGTNRDRLIAAGVAQEQLEVLRSMGAAQALQSVSLQPSTTVPVNGKVFTVTQTATQQDDAVTGNPCLGAAAGQNSFLKLSVSVSWPGIGVTKPVRSDTVLTPRAGTGVSTSIRVRVIDRTGAGVKNAAVSLAPTTALTSVATVYTDNAEGYGCAVFNGLAKGSYQISVSKSGHVSSANAATHVEVVAADPAEPAPVLVVDYDQAAGVALRFTAVTGFLQPTGSPGMVLANPGLRPLGVQHFTARASDSLFPFSSGYQAWLGLCRDADPTTYGAVRTSAAVTPGVLSSTAPNPHSVPGGRLVIDVEQRKNGGGNAWETAGGVTVQATNTSTTCSTPQSFVLGATDSSGRLSVLVPYGSWRFTVVNRCYVSGGGPATFTPSTPQVNLGLRVERTAC